MIIYKITNLFNGKIYVGQTIKTLAERIAQHKCGDLYIDRAIKTYGIKFFKAEVIEKCANLEELNKREKFWIEKLNSKYPNAYNHTDGDAGWNFNNTKWKNVRQVIIDDKTGEIEGYFSKSSKKLVTRISILPQEIAKNIAMAKLTNEQYRVIIYLLGVLDFDNYLCISHTKISEELRMKRPSVSRAMKTLKQLDIIVEGPRAGLNKTYRLNPNIAHKGKDKDQTAIDFSGEKRRRRPKVEVEDE